MNAFVSIVVVVAVVAAWFWRGEDAPSQPRVSTSIVVPEGQGLTQNLDAEEVFQRAFWRRPSENDVIKHGERREWSDKNGVARWQWFIEVGPSAALQSDLFEKNRFSLHRSSAQEVSIDERPPWFPEPAAEDVILSAGGGEMVIISRPGGTTLFATGVGGGFERGMHAPQRASISNHIEMPRRLPKRPPPHPED